MNKADKDKVIALLEQIQRKACIDPPNSVSSLEIGPMCRQIEKIMRGLEDTNNVKIPTSIEEATAMHLVATAWLKQNRGLEDAEPVPGESLDDLLGRYWDLAYAEGHSRGEESYGNAANAVLHKIRALYTSPQVAQTEAALCEMVRLSEDAGLYDSDFQAGRAGSKP